MRSPREFLQELERDLHFDFYGSRGLEVEKRLSAYLDEWLSAYLDESNAHGAVVCEPAPEQDQVLELPEASEDTKPDGPDAEQQADEHSGKEEGQ